MCPSEQLRSISLTPPILLASPSLLFQCCLPSSGALVRLSVGINHWLRADPMAKARQVVAHSFSSQGQHFLR